MAATVRWFLKRTFPVVVLTGLLAAGWGLLTAPSNQAGLTQLGDAQLWGAKIAGGNRGTSAIDSWN